MLHWMIDSKAFEYDRHYSNCKKSNHPFIKARKNPETGGYLVFLDMATCDYRLSKKGQEELGALFESVTIPNSKNHCELTRELCSFDGVLPEKLNGFLSELYEVTKKHQESI